jgi:hypothetical protein
MFKNIQNVVYSIGNTKITFKGDKTTITPAILESKLGEARDPDYTTSQKDFQLLVVVLTKTPLTAAQWNLVDTHAKVFSRQGATPEFGLNFWEATDGKATMKIGGLRESQLSFVLGVDKEANKGVHIYPNPTKSNISIEFSDKSVRINKAQLISALGKINTLSPASFSNYKTRIDVSSFAKGIYVLKLELNKGKVITRKIKIE